MSDKHTHTSDCDWHVDQYLWECTCGAIPKKQAMDNLIAQDADLIDKLRDEDSYYRLQEKHWCIDAEELERQRLAAADHIEALEAENERLREAGTTLAGFAEHDELCAYQGYWWRKNRTCDCGYTDAWKAWSAALKETEQ